MMCTEITVKKPRVGVLSSKRRRPPQQDKSLKKYKFLLITSVKVGKKKIKTIHILFTRFIKY